MTTKEIVHGQKWLGWSTGKSKVGSKRTVAQVVVRFTPLLEAAMSVETPQVKTKRAKIEGKEALLLKEKQLE